MFHSTSYLDFQIQDFERVEDFSQRLHNAGGILALLHTSGFSSF
jgi:hypothetical protein